MDYKKAQDIQLSVEKTYNNIASEFSNTRQNAWIEFEHFSKFLTPKCSILDFGCGNGRLFQSLQSKFNEIQIKYEGLDISEELIKKAQASHPNQKFTHYSTLPLPYSNQSFNQVWAIASIHHIPSKALRLQTLQEINRLLKPQGIFIFTVWNLFQKKYRKYIYESIKTSIKNFGKTDWNDTFIPWKGQNPRYYHAFTTFELFKLLKQSKFEVLDFFYVNKGERVKFSKSHNICFICRKK
jgi:SAM-dependent methyltransferase